MTLLQKHTTQPRSARKPFAAPAPPAATAMQCRLQPPRLPPASDAQLLAWMPELNPYTDASTKPQPSFLPSFQMLMNDVMRLLSLYVLTLVGFALAFHVILGAAGPCPPELVCATYIRHTSSPVLFCFFVCAGGARESSQSVAKPVVSPRAGHSGTGCRSSPPGYVYMHQCTAVPAAIIIGCALALA